MKKTLSLVLTLTALLLIGCNSQQSLQVMHVRSMENQAGKQGFYYSLPRTMVSVDVTVTRTEKQPGPFAGYADRYLGLKEVIHDHAVTYQISEININSYSEPDPSHFYFVEADPENWEENPIYLALSQSGLISSVNTPFDSQEFFKGIPETKEYGFFGTEATFNYFIDHNLREQIDTIVEHVRVDTITVERQTLRRSWVEKSMDIRAKDVAEFILNIRDKKFDLISGFAEIPYSKEALEYMYTEMEEMENDYLDLFTGITSTTTLRYRYTWMPDKDRAGSPAPLFHFSTLEGVLPAGNENGIPVTIEATRTEATRQAGLYMDRNEDPRQPSKGFQYRIPEHGNVIIREGQNIRAEARMLINQFGITGTLPALDMEIKFFPNTGSIESVGRLKTEEERN